jgi:uncharacterized protein
MIQLPERYPYHKPIILGDEEFHPGENGIPKINIGKLPSGNQIKIQAHIYRAENTGPTLLILAGIHGDEISSLEVARRFVEQKWHEKIIRGSVIVVPLVNVFGFINFSRDLLDGRDVNRSFPGIKSGTLASRVAYAITKEFLPYVDAAIDMHTGGSARYNYPQVRYAKSDPKAKELAQAFAAPLSIATGLIPKSFRKIARDHKIPALIFEGGESVRLDGYSIHCGLEGIKRVLFHLGMLDEKHIYPANKSISCVSSTWIRAQQSGLFEWTKCSGQWVRKNELLGYIRDPYGLKSHQVLCTKSGVIIGHNNASVVNQGDALFHIGMNE